VLVDEGKHSQRLSGVAQAQAGEVAGGPALERECGVEHALATMAAVHVHRQSLAGGRRVADVLVVHREDGRHVQPLLRSARPPVELVGAPLAPRSVVTFAASETTRSRPSGSGSAPG
jgi:hypothetical protein